jgi:hypothetical protein
MYPGTALIAGKVMIDGDGSPTGFQPVGQTCVHAQEGVYEIRLSCSTPVNMLCNAWVQYEGDEPVPHVQVATAFGDDAFIRIYTKDEADLSTLMDLPGDSYLCFTIFIQDPSVE